ncbi:adenosylcobalamin-dependent ribonucleoside-diphosphate reductase [Candidatus Woesearchaeota archaeon]|nr:adenosylcobalamin-dependent ribonucleoside-diphosphate reductase [Candidatus Woesearchaeota archaeon]
MRGTDGFEEFEKGLSDNDKLSFNENQLRIIYAKYLRRDEKGNVIETPPQMYRRIAHTIASPEAEYKDQAAADALEEEFYNVLVSLDFLPGGRTMANAGTPVKNLANCFVIPVEDSMEGIFEAVKKAALIQKRGGGVGYCFSTLRPKNSWVSGCSGVASGPISFMKVFNVMCSTIMQGNRRGAQMATFHVWHPDIEEFISAKDDLTQLTNFNISVMVDDKFMRAVENDGEYELIDPKDNKVIRKVKAKELFDKIAYHAWKTGEPGVLFVDTANKYNTVRHLGEFRATNPCAEIWLLDYEVCNLGSINLDRMVKIVNGKTEIDWGKLNRTIRTAIHFLDNVIDAGEYPTPEISEMAKKTRRVGLGVLGFADLLYQLGIPYSSKEGRDVAEKILKTMDEEGWKKSMELAESKGVFPGWSGSEFEKQGRKVRNCAITAIAPTGTLSMVADSSGGCEPNFALAYIKNSHSIKETFTYVNKHFEKTAKDRGFYSKELMKKVAEQGTLDGIEEVPDDVKKVFEVSFNTSAEEHILMQAAFQKHVSNAVSKTINFPNSATIDDVKEGYMLAWKNGCKGVTVYRDGSRGNQVLNIKEVKKESEQQSEAEMPEAEEQDDVKEAVVPQEEIAAMEAEEMPSQEQLMVMAGSHGQTTVTASGMALKVNPKQLLNCPECNTKLVKQEGCVLCPDCGFSACDV